MIRSSGAAGNPPGGREAVNVGLGPWACWLGHQPGAFWLGRWAAGAKGSGAGRREAGRRVKGPRASRPWKPNGAASGVARLMPIDASRIIRCPWGPWAASGLAGRAAVASDLRPGASLDGCRVEADDGRLDGVRAPKRGVCIQ